MEYFEITFKSDDLPDISRKLLPCRLEPVIIDNPCYIRSPFHKAEKYGLLHVQSNSLNNQAMVRFKKM